MASKVVDEAAGLIGSLIGPGESRKGLDRRVARKTNIPFTRVRNIRLKRARRIEVHEIESLRALGSAQGDADAAAGNQDLESLKDQIAALVRRIERLESPTR